MYLTQSQCSGVRTVSALASAFAACLALNGCASSRGAQIEAPPSGRAVMLMTTETVTTLEAAKPATVSGSVAKPKAEVWNLAKQVLADYNVQMTVEDVTRGWLGNGEFYKTREFAGKRMTDLFNCGMGMTGPNAASYRIYMSLMISVADNAPRGSLVGVTVAASARDMNSGATADRVICGSSGQLEKLVLSRISTLAGLSANSPDGDSR